MELHQLLEEGESVHARHLDVEDDAVGLELEDLLARGEWVGGRRDDLDTWLA